MATQFAGVYPAPPTPTFDDGRVNEAALRALLDDNIRHGVHGFWMAGSTGEGPILDDEQRRRLASELIPAAEARATQLGVATNLRVFAAQLALAEFVVNGEGKCRDQTHEFMRIQAATLWHLSLCLRPRRGCASQPQYRCILMLEGELVSISIGILKHAAVDTLSQFMQIFANTMD